MIDQVWYAIGGYTALIICAVAGLAHLIAREIQHRFDIRDSEAAAAAEAKTQDPGMSTEIAELERLYKLEQR